jgi:hypothetical protein
MGEFSEEATLNNGVQFYVQIVIDVSTGQRTGTILSFTERTSKRCVLFRSQVKSSQGFG